MSEQNEMKQLFGFDIVESQELFDAVSGKFYEELALQGWVGLKTTHKDGELQFEVSSKPEMIIINDLGTDKDWTEAKELSRLNASKSKS